MPNTASSRLASTLLLVSLAAATGCAGGPSVATSGAPRPGSITDPHSQIATSTSGMVASASTFATEVGAQVLARGGNAVDAAAATAFALAVTEPSMSGLGGRSSILIRTAEGEFFGIDGLNQVPNSYRAGAPAGYSNAAIPGVPAALALAIERYGTWTLAEIIAPAVRLAEEGFPLTTLTAQRLADNAEELRSFPGSRRYFLKPDGSPWRAGELFVQRDLARTLRAIADGGVRAFYEGWVADSVDAEMRRGGGFVTREELAGYRALPAIMVHGNYRGYRLASNYSPAAGHTVIEALQIMQHFDLPALPEADYASITGQAMQLALSDRSRSFGTPEESAARLTSAAYAAERARDVGVPGPPPADSDPEPWWLRPDQDNTTHLSVVDSRRMAVALTQSLGPILGTRLAASGTGFLFATRLGSTPGSRPASTISPTIVSDSTGAPRYVLGAAGDSRIITAVIQTISRVIDRGMTLDAAVSAHRVHPMGRTSIRVEMDPSGRRWSDADVARLAAVGFTVDSAPSTYFARIHAVGIDWTSGVLTGVAEPRGGGGAAGVRALTARSGVVRFRTSLQPR